MSWIKAGTANILMGLGIILMALAVKLDDTVVLRIKRYKEMGDGK